MKAGFGVQAALALIGVTAAIAQIVLLRELMVVFYGNEISIGLMLASWLFWTATGSSLAGHFAARVTRPRRLMAGLQVLTAATLPCTIPAVRAAKGLLQTVPGEILGPYPMLLTSFSTLGPLCALSGALFTFGSKVYATTTATGAGEANGSAYLWEAAGSAGGGAIAGLFLVQNLSSLEIAGVLALLNLLAASALAITAGLPRYAAMGGLASIAVVAVSYGWPGSLEAISQRRLWRGLNLISTRNSAYGNLAVIGTEGSRSFYENGVLVFNVPDPAAAEEAVHYALLEHPSPRSLLLIGGGLNGSIAQALRHPTLARVDYLELDPAILEMVRDQLPDEWRALRADPRVHVHVADGRLFLKTTQASFDVVIVNLPEPQNAQINRFYTVEFFHEVSRRLSPAGLLSFQLRSSENYMSAELVQFLRSIHQSLRAVFPRVTAIPGETVHFFAARRAGTLASGPDELLARLHARHLGTSYVSEYFIPFRMAPDRMAESDKQFQPTPGDATKPRLNRDFTPVAYYFDVALWSSQFNQGYRRLFGAMAGVGFGALVATFGALLAALVAAGRILTKRRYHPRFAAACCTAATGFTMMGLEMLLLLVFQAVYGYVYQQLAIVIAAFMGGMALGSWLATRRAARGGMRVLAITQILAAAAPLFLVGLFQWIGSASNPAASQIAFPALALGSGMLGGFEFPVAAAIFFDGARTQNGFGTLYALDLAGSCLGAILFSAWLIPVFGFLKTALLSAIAGLAAAATTVPLPADARRTPGP